MNAESLHGDFHRVELYGVDHSPWVQAVILGLQERGIEFELSTVPTLQVFRRTGVLMPMARIDDNAWLADSERILIELGFPALTRDERKSIQAAMTGSAMHRRNGRLDFWRGFARIRETHPSWLRRHFKAARRAFATLYFFSIITYGRRVLGRATNDETRAHFGALQDRLDDNADFFGGAVPNIVDLQLFGIVQMIASIPVPPLDVLREDESLVRLRAWIATMQARFAASRHLYSGAYFVPALPAHQAAPASERVAFGVGAVVVCLALPVTLPLVVFLARRVRRRGKA